MKLRYLRTVSRRFLSCPQALSTVCVCVCVCMLHADSGMNCVFCHLIKPVEIVQSCEQNQNDSS